ncbi:unannotated protein [freshwater metagenome]|uniref:Unannotated protein n=1 Tax=freshwater metagenome TaxID=449393 RepID=A0A6J7NZD3_9ZZZZ
MCPETAHRFVVGLKPSDSASTPNFTDPPGVGELVAFTVTSEVLAAEFPPVLEPEPLQDDAKSATAATAATITTVRRIMNASRAKGLPEVTLPTERHP